MKNIFLKFAFIILITSSLSCSKNTSDEESIEPENNSVPTTYLPLKTGNFWNYTVENRASNNDPASTNTPPTTSTDLLTVGNDVTYNNIVHKKMETPLPPNGFFSSTLKDNGLRIDGTRLRVSGTLNNNLLAGLALNINLVDFIILKDNSDAGVALSSVSGTTNQVVSGYNLTINYTLSSMADGTLASYTSGGRTYNNVKKTKIYLNISITTPIGGFPAPIVDSQNVIVSTLHFAPQIGMIYDHRVFNFVLNPAMPPALLTQLTDAGFPSRSNQLQEEFIGLFDVSH